MAKAIEINNNFKEGQEYYCPECDRIHKKGKIYKEHLKYALKGTEETEEEVEEMTLEEYDDEAELIEVFDELDAEGFEEGDGTCDLQR